MAVARVVGDDFAKPWYQFFNSLLQDSAYEMLPKPCFEVYLNNGAEDGYWDIEMYVAVQPKTSLISSQGGVLTRRPLFF
ncbi:DNA gyrase inhibitory protein [Escherichia coli]|uniref:DNA gyrase inhibitory protein n=1 Tax=Escherichia coli TaxID=562 RepID=A0A376S8V3_ECOLX|nr:DNA gyrase inhibitory protein [Escherichia coli]